MHYSPRFVLHPNPKERVDWTGNSSTLHVSKEVSYDPFLADSGMLANR